MFSDNHIPFSVGALLYSPANNKTIAHSIINERFGNLFSLSLCLEDSIGDSEKAIEAAQDQIVITFQTLKKALQYKTFYLPKIFIRVREPKQALLMFKKLKGCQCQQLLTGFIFPKFDLENDKPYIQIIQEINALSSHTIYMMPILESSALLSLKQRYDMLYSIKDSLDSISELVLNVRVGGNDLCHTLGLRRNKEETIYDILPISQILSDILTVYSRDYVVSGVVWEYFNGTTQKWKIGMRKELQLDRLNGFIGKTVIHPNQIPIVNESLKVRNTDLEDARSILSWDKNSDSMVSKNPSAERMNEYKTHTNWARKILILSEIYGVKHMANGNLTHLKHNFL